MDNSESFYCWRELQRYPTSELSMDDENNLIHNRSPSHYALTGGVVSAVGSQGGKNFLMFFARVNALEPRVRMPAEILGALDVRMPNYVLDDIFQDVSTPDEVLDALEMRMPDEALHEPMVRTLGEILNSLEVRMSREVLEACLGLRTPKDFARIVEPVTRLADWRYHQ